LLYLQKQVWSMKLIERSNYTERIERAFGKGVIVALTGQRRVGKSCIMAQVMRHIGSLPQANVVYLNKEKNEFDDIRDYNDLLGFVNGRLSKDKDNYLFIDEIQDIDGFERALRSLQADDACQIMVTGSNAKMLSSELTTYLSGRHIDYHIHSLGYEEFLLFHKMPDGDEALTAYLQYGGLPQLGRMGLDDRELVDDYLESVYSTILLKDIVERGQIRNVSLLKTLVRFMADNIGKLFSATSIVNFLKGQRVDTSAKVILNYLDLLCDAYIINRVSRYDIHGKRIFELGDKYYFEDLGLRNHIVGGNRSADIEKVMENAVYLHLLRMGYKVYVGQLHKTEIDFVAEKSGSTVYVQVAYLLASQETINREFGNLKLIDDNHPKYVISLDRMMGDVNADGIRHIYLRDFLKMRTL
jgi:predicted AAA+ superfamily ATPase